jgi:hypothetical protein
MPAPAPAPAAPAVPTSPAPRAAADSGEIELPLSRVLAALPLDLRAKLVSGLPVHQTIRLEAEAVIGQLAFGAVKISFGELRRLAPGVFVNSGGEFDNKLVNLPLQEILPRLNPALLARRSPRKVEVAAEIVGPFSERGRGFSFTTQPLKGPAATLPAPPPASRPAIAPSPAIGFVPPIDARQVSPTPLAPHLPPRSITPSAPANGTHDTSHSHPLSPSPLSPRMAMPPATNGNGHGNGTNGQGNGHGPSLPPGLRLGPMNGNGRTELSAPLRMAAAPAPTPSAPSSANPRPAAAAAAPVSAASTIIASLGDLCENWPAELKDGILRSPLAHKTVALQGAAILPGLKRGRVVMTWKQLQLLAQLNSSPSPQDNLELELPLKVIAPLFLAAQKTSSRGQVKTTVSKDIPDLFFGFPQAIPPAAPAAPAPPGATATPAHATPIIPVVPVVPAAPGAPAAPPSRTQDTNYYVWGDRGEAPQADEASLRRGETPQTDFLTRRVPQTDFMSRKTHPREVVTRAAALPGVAGSVVAMQDGLRVASQTPPDLNADTLAAFLPQIFERVGQSTRELRMGPLNDLNFIVGTVPWRIFRINAVYFAAFGGPGGQLPSAQLVELAAELDRKKQP